MTLEQEMKTAREKYGPFNSTHEVYGVLQEEVDEFFDLIRYRPVQAKMEMIKELTQVAAIALRAIDELEKGEIKFV